MKIQWLQNKRVLKSLILFILLVLTVFMINHNAFAFGGEGHFEKVDYGNKPFYSAEPVKIKNGKVIFPPNHIFDPKTNKVTEVKDKTFFDGILLEDGRIFHAEAVLEHPLEQSRIKDGLYKILKDNGVSYTKEQYYTWDVKDKEKFFLPYLKKNPELYKEYKEALDSYEKSMHGIISDPETGRFEYTKGKMNVRRNDAYKFLLDDGKVILIGGRKAAKDGFGVGSAQQIEIFNPKTGKFSLMQDGNLYPHYAFKINNDKFMLIHGDDYIFYNTNSNNFSNKKSFLKDLGSHQTKIVGLTNENLFIFADPYKRNLIKQIANTTPVNTSLAQVLIYDIKTDSFKYGRSLAHKRGYVSDFGSAMLNDGRILIFGGVSDSDIFGMHNYPTNSAEIYDPKTGISKQTGNMKYARFKDKGIVLDDGRVLIFGYPNIYRDKGSIYREIDKLELYIPQGYSR